MIFILSEFKVHLTLLKLFYFLFIKVFSPSTVFWLFFSWQKVNLALHKINLILLHLLEIFFHLPTFPRILRMTLQTFNEHLNIDRHIWVVELLMIDHGINPVAKQVSLPLKAYFTLFKQSTILLCFEDNLEFLERNLWFLV